jgi:hypothetical protein
LLEHSTARQTPCLPSCKDIVSNMRWVHTVHYPYIIFFIPSLYLNIPSP